MSKRVGIGLLTGFLAEKCHLRCYDFTLQFKGITQPVYKSLQQKFSLYQQSYAELNGWRLAWDYGKRRAGACFPRDKKITISRHHIRLNAEDTIVDTFNHEIAHALAWERHQYAGHGEPWKSIVSQLGGIASARGAFRVPVAPWVLVLRQDKLETVTKIAERYRKNSKIHLYMLKSQPETRGNLFYLSRKDYIDWCEQSLDYSALNFVR